MPTAEQNQRRLFAMPFVRLYPSYVQKAEKKARTKAEVDRIICWLTGHTPAGLKRELENESDVESFVTKAPKWNPNATLITGVVCGVRVEEVEDPLMRKLRQLDKLVDELAKGRAMEQILRDSPTK